MKMFSKFKTLQARSKSAFTLIELLMVIAIIGILAALVVGSSGYAARIMKISRVTAELKQLETAIGAYKAALGSYPPDNPGQPDRSPLFYELIGTRVANPSSPIFVNGIESVPAASVLSFGVQGFQNTVVSGSDSDIKSFLTQLKAKQYTNHPTATAVKVLVVPVEGPGGNVNPWRYVSTSPTNNPHGYDLWAEVVIGGKTYVIGNWKN